MKKVEEEKKGEEEKPKAEEEKPKAEEAAAEKAEEPKKEGEEKSSGDAPATEEAVPPPPPPEEIEMRVFMHCEGCARKVKRCLKRFDGVEDVTTDCKTHKVVVKGKKAAEDPMKVVDRIKRKTGRKVELLTPLPPPKVEEKKEEPKEEEKPKVEEKKEEPVVIAVVLKVHMHCEACAQEIKKRILKMKGVQAVEPDIKASQVTVKGIFEPPKLVEYVYKRTGKHTTIVKTEPDKKPEEEKQKEDEKPKEEEEKKPEEKAEGEKAESKEEETLKEKEEAAPEGEVVAVKIEPKKNELHYYYPRYPVEYAYPPQIFSDENPNACSIM